MMSTQPMMTWSMTIQPHHLIELKFDDAASLLNVCIAYRYTYDVPVEGSRGAIEDKFITSSAISCAQFFTALAPSTSGAFRRHFAEGIDCYLGGPDGSEADWPAATMLLQFALELKPNDGPCQAILRFMEAMSTPEGHCPDHWKGYQVNNREQCACKHPHVFIM